MSNFHRVTQYGSKIRHATVTGVTCDTAHHQLWQEIVTWWGAQKGKLSETQHGNITCLYRKKRKREWGNAPCGNVTCCKLCQSLKRLLQSFGWKWATRGVWVLVWFPFSLYCWSNLHFVCNHIHVHKPLISEDQLFSWSTQVIYLYCSKPCSCLFSKFSYHFLSPSQAHSCVLAPRGP